MHPQAQARTAQLRFHTEVEVSQSLNEGPVGADLLVVPLGEQDADVSGVHALVKRHHLCTSIHVVHFEHHLRGRGRGERGREGGRKMKKKLQELQFNCFNSTKKCLQN